MKETTLAIILLLSLFISSCKFEDGFIIKDEEVANVNDMTFDYLTSDFKKTVLPIKFVKNIPLVLVKINNYPYYMEINLGAKRDTVSVKPEIVKLFNLEYLGKKWKERDAVGNIYPARLFKLPSITIGELELTNVTVREELRSFVHGSGIIGNVLLKDFSLFINYPEETITLYKKGEYPKELEKGDWTQTRFEEREYGIVIKAKMRPNGKYYEFVIDTAVANAYDGKVYDVIQPFKHFAKRDVNPRQEATTSSNFIIEGESVGEISFFCFGFGDPPVDGFLGSAFFKTRLIFIDREMKTMYVRNLLKRPGQ